MDNTAIWSAIIAGILSLLTFFTQKLLSKSWERRSVSSAILAEIQTMLVVIATHQGYWQGWMDQKETQRHPLIPFSCDVYEKFVDKLGMVRPKYVGLVVQFYGYLKFVNALQAVRNDEADFDAIYNNSLCEITEKFGTAFDSAFEAYGLKAKA